MADDFDPFEAFNDEDSSVQDLELMRQQKAREDTENLLRMMTSSISSAKRPSSSNDFSTPPVEKQSRTNIENMKSDTNIISIQEESVKVEAMEVNEDDEIQNLNMESSNRIINYKIEAEGCTHEVAYPYGMDYTPLVWRQTEPAKKYPFKLDAFQKEAINCIDNNQSVLVSAHTSAGKTANALYAIAMALRDNQRVIYTSPIKALSNQKFRELSDEFHDVGLMTGDVTLNPEASCIVMTTEILRSMLYRGSEIMREVGWVIFDEIHYMRDKERGVVWEETIILLPDNVHYVFLSATIPNARQFAEWVCYLHKQPCHVICTDYRPVPLMHFIYPADGEGLYEVLNIQGHFNEDKFKTAMLGLQEAGNASDDRGRRSRASQQKNDSNVIKLVRTIKERDMLPCIVFSFSRRECEAYASCLKDMDFNSDDEKKMVRTIFTSAINLLSDEDRQIDQIKLVEPFLVRGIGVHHSGLLPIIKEVIEILFGESLIKVLFATETFSMGLNMPARTVLFTSARKYDGKDYRGEYIQMSGRAGRRGKDDKGLVIMMLDQAMSSDVAKQIIKGQADPLNSQFRLTYNMVLNLLRVEGINPEFMLEKSFYQFQNYSSLPDLLNKCKNKKREHDNLKIEHEPELQGYFEMEKRIDELKENIRKTIIKPKHVVPFLSAGRLFHIKANGYDFGWGFLLNFHKKIDPLSDSDELIYVLDIALHISRESAKHFQSNPNVNVIRPPVGIERGVLEVCSFLLTSVYEVSTIRMKMPNDLQGREKLNALSLMHEKAMERFNNLPPIMDPIKDMKIKNEEFKKQTETLQMLEQRKLSHPLRKRPNFEALCKEYQKKLDLYSEYKEAKEAFKKAKSLLQLDELGCRKRVLRRLQYCDDSDVITHKGRVACEVSAADELLLTEMIFSGVFNSLSPEQCASLLSCFVFEEKANVAKLPDDLAGCLKTMQTFARKIAKATNEAKMQLDEETYVESFRPQLMDVVYQWCAGSSFKEILKTTEIFEGSIIRALRRLEELLREMIGAAKSIGNTELEQKFETARNQLKRDIVFAASLYL